MEVVELEGKKVFKDVVCGFCGSLCDHLIVEVEGDKITKVTNACAIGRERFLNARENRLLHPMIKENGQFKRVSLEEAVEKAVEILKEADLPLIYGLSSTVTEAMRPAADIAELLGGIIDQTASTCHGPTAIALQEVGIPTTTLGEVKNRADLVIFWGSNPMDSHFNHPFRYSVVPSGLYVEGRKGRKVITVDVRKTKIAAMSDLFIQVKPGRDHELVAAMRAILKGRKLGASEIAGVPMEKIEELVETIKESRYAVIFIGMGLTQQKGKELTIANLVKFCQEAHEHTKALIAPMRGHGNVKGAGMFLSWRTGYPFMVDFSRGYPRYFPGETSLVDVLTRGEVDAALVIASDPAANLPLAAAKHLARIPLITIDVKPSVTTKISDVVIPAAISGIEAEGTMYRMDGIPIEVKKIIEPPNEEIKSDEEILEMIYERLRREMGE